MNVNAKQQELQRQIEKDNREKLLQIEEKKVSLLEKINEYIEKELIEQKEQSIEKRKFTFNASNQIFETKGFKYSTFIVSETNKDTVIEVEYDLERFNMTLNSGFNRLNLPNGCLVRTADNKSITVSLILSKDRF